MCSLGGQAEQDMVTFSEFFISNASKINVVYHEWIEDCLKERRVLPVDPYVALD